MNRFRSNAGWVQVLGIERDADLMYTLGHQMLWGLFSATSEVLAYVSYLWGRMDLCQ